MHAIGWSLRKPNTNMHKVYPTITSVIQILLQMFIFFRNCNYFSCYLELLFDCDSVQCFCIIVLVCSLFWHIICKYQRSVNIVVNADLTPPIHLHTKFKDCFEWSMSSCSLLMFGQKKQIAFTYPCKVQVRRTHQK